MKQEHEMTPGVLVSGEVLSAGDARARVAVLEAELAELRKRVCVPEGYTVVPAEPTSAMLGARDDDGDRLVEEGEYYFSSIDSAVQHMRRVYKGMIAFAPAPVERNQCDGCQAGIPAENGMHRMGKPGEYPDLMACTADRYAPQPAAPAAQGVSGLPFARKILEKLERFRECAEDDEGVDIGRNWLDMLTHLGLLNRVQRSPARWEMTAQADDALEAAHQSGGAK